MGHPLHELIGNILKKNEKNFVGCRIIYDPACGISNSGDKQHIPLFSSKNKSRSTKFCDVDILIIKNERIKIIVEIDESNVKPNHIGGKFLTSALSSHYIHPKDNNEAIEMNDSVSFIQVLDTSKLHTKNSSKKVQWENLEESIRKNIPLKDSSITNYKIILGEPTEAVQLEKQLVNQILKNL